MAEIDVTIEVLSPIHLGSGQANVNVDSEIVHDALGFPYFPAKRFKGLLYESALEVWEMFELGKLSTGNLSELERIFHRQSESNVQLIVPNFFIKPLTEYENFCAEWRYLQSKYPGIFTATQVLNAFTSLRYQTQLIDGVAKEGSLHNMRVLDAGIKFFGRVTVLNADEKIFNLLALALKNLSSAGTKRNRGFGRIKCSATFGGVASEKIVEKFFAKEA